MYLRTDDRKEIDRGGTSHVSFPIGNPARLVTAFHYDLNPVIRAFSERSDSITTR